nr:uncharacterized protein LOC124814469 [Hydra vulgaris]
MLREIAGNGILFHKQGRERGQGWSAVANVINTYVKMLLILRYFSDTENKNDNESQQKKLVNETEKNKTVEMRAKAMERFGKTRKRNDENNVSPKKY